MWLLKNGSRNVKIASAVKVTLALCVCCLLVPKNSRFFYALPLPSFFFHTSVSRSCLPFLTCCLFIFFLQFFSSSPTHLFLPNPSNALSLHPSASLLLSPFPSFSFLFPICNCTPFHSSYLILSFPPVSFLSLLLAPSVLHLFPTSLLDLDLENPLACLSLTSHLHFLFPIPSSHFSSVLQPVFFLVFCPAAGCLSSARSRASLLSR